MRDEFHQHLDRSQWVRVFAAWANRLPFPYSRLVLRVRGHRMCAHTLDRYLTLWLWKLKRLEHAALECAAAQGRPGMHAVDIGANLGVYTLAMAGAAGDDGRVWAFEPESGNATTLRKNIALNGYANVTVVEKAVGDRSGQAELYLDEAHQGDHRLFDTGMGRVRQPVDVVALDDYFPAGQPLDLVKIDVQGAEALVLRGMQRILTQTPSLVVLMEMSIGDPVAPGCSAEDVVENLVRLGYRLAWIDESRRRVVSASGFGACLGRLRSCRYRNVVAFGPGASMRSAR